DAGVALLALAERRLAVPQRRVRLLQRLLRRPALQDLVLQRPVGLEQLVGSLADAGVEGVAALAQHLLGALPLRDVHRHADRAGDLAVRVAKRLDVGLERAPPPLLLVGRADAFEGAAVGGDGVGAAVRRRKDVGKARLLLPDLARAVPDG